MVGIERVSNEQNADYILMLKNPETGFFEEELGRYKIGSDEDLVEGLHAEQTEEGAYVCLRVGVGRLWAEIGDPLYEYIFNEYDVDSLPGFVTELIEIDGHYNPMWEARFLFSENPAETEDMIRQVLAGHRKALSILRSDTVKGDAYEQ